MARESQASASPEQSVESPELSTNAAGDTAANLTGDGQPAGSSTGQIINLPAGPELPRMSAEPSPELRMAMDAISALTQALQRMDQRLARLETSRVDTTPHDAPPDTEKSDVVKEYAAHRREHVPPGQYRLF